MWSDERNPDYDNLDSFSDEFITRSAGLQACKQGNCEFLVASEATQLYGS